MSIPTRTVQPVPVSILIPIKNEAANLPRCLASVAWAGEVFVVDSQSTDGSQEIAERHGAAGSRRFHHRFPETLMLVFLLRSAAELHGA